MPIPTITQLEAELVQIVSALPAFTNKAFSIYSLADLERMIVGQTANLPFVGVGYDGAVQVGDAVNPRTQQKVLGAAPIDVQFLIILAVSYGSTNQNDTKQDATDLLGAIRSAVIGYKEVNSRAWRFIGERPEAEASGDGVIFYSQVWQTTIIVVGNS